MRLLFMLLVVLPLLVAFPPPATAKSTPRITVSLAPDTLLVGDRVHCVISVEHKASEVAVLEGIDSLSIQPFELVSRKQSSVAVSPVSGKERFELELALFGSGQQPFPPFTVVVRDTQGLVTSRTVYRPSTSVFVKALTDSSIRDLRPIKSPVKPTIPFLLLLPLLLGALGVAVLVLLLLFFLKQIVRARAEKVDHGQVAQRKLRKLGSRLSGGMPPHECYEELSNIMRSFLENHYHIRALEAVTHEIERDLKKLGVAGFESIMNLLAQADLVKFADSRPDAEESRQSLKSAEQVIRSARPSEALPEE